MSHKDTEHVQRQKKKTKEGIEFSLVKQFTRVIMGPSAVLS
jgi:hypothetical protein